MDVAECLHLLFLFVISGVMAENVQPMLEKQEVMVNGNETCKYVVLR